MRHIYIAGPMAGYPGHNIRSFEAAAKRLRSLGFTVTSPHEVGQQLELICEDKSQLCVQDFLAEDIGALLECDSIFLLTGWEMSCGATCEAAIAKSMGYDFVDIRGEVIPSPEIITIRRSYPKNMKVEILPEAGGENSALSP